MDAYLKLLNKLQNNTETFNKADELWGLLWELSFDDELEEMIASGNMGKPIKSLDDVRDIVERFMTTKQKEAENIFKELSRL